VIIELETTPVFKNKEGGTGDSTLRPRSTGGNFKPIIKIPHLPIAS